MAIITSADYESITGITLNPAETARVNSLIPIVQSQIETYCDRYFDSATYSEWFDYSKYIVLRQYPVTLIKYVGTANKVATFSNTSSYTFNIAPTQIDIIDDNLSSTTITLGGTNDTLSNVSSAVTTAIPTMTLTVEAGYESMNYQLFRSGTGENLYGAVRSTVATRLLDDENRTVELLSLTDSYFPYSANYCCFDHNVFIVYTAGYTAATYPKALQYICAMIIKDVINIQDAGITGLLTGETITNYSWQSNAEMIGYVGKEMDKYLGELEPFVKKVI